MINGTIDVNGLKNKVTNMATQKAEHDGHNNASRTYGITTILRLTNPQILE
jgi:hypothetical protein